MAQSQGYPPARGRAPGVRPGTGEKYERQQSSGQVSATDTSALLIQFSGRPDTVVLSCHENGAIFTLSDRLSTDAEEILVPADVTHETHFAAERILVRNHAPGSTAHVCAVGKWAEPAESTRGHR